MNRTSEDFYFYIDRAHPLHDETCEGIEIGYDYDADPAEVTPTSSDDSETAETASVESLMQWHSDAFCWRLSSKGFELEARKKKNVTFNESIEIRDYSITVGDHPCCTSGLALTLDWAHTENPRYVPMECCSERTSYYKLPPRLNYEQRRNRLFAVSTHAEECVRNDELDLVMKFLQRSWSRQTFLPLPLYEDLSTEEDDPSQGPVMRWERFVGVLASCSPTKLGAMVIGVSERGLHSIHEICMQICE